MVIFNSLLDKLNQIKPLTATDIVLYKEVFKILHLKWNDYFLLSSEVCDKIGYLHKGLVRYFVFRKDE